MNDLLVHKKMLQQQKAKASRLMQKINLAMDNHWGDTLDRVLLQLDMEWTDAYLSIKYHERMIKKYEEANEKAELAQATVTHAMFQKCEGGQTKWEN